MKSLKCFTDSEFNHLHDIVYNLTGKQSTIPRLKEIFGLLPNIIQAEAILNGLNDTVFRDNTYIWLERNQEILEKIK